MRPIAPSSRQSAAHTSLETTEFVTNNNMVIVPHPLYSPDLAPCDIASFPKLKMKLKGRCFKTVSDIQRESQAVLDSFKEYDFRGVFEALKKRCVPKGTILTVMATKIE
jgi:transposase